MCGVIFGAMIIYYFTKTRFARITREKGRVVPEERLIPMMIGGGCLPVGLFWWAWTSSPNMTAWWQIVAGTAIGMGKLLMVC
jgi:MFS transporter, DHA1 family, multidrug resistance protein